MIIRPCTVAITTLTCRVCFNSWKSRGECHNNCRLATVRKEFEFGRVGILKKWPVAITMDYIKFSCK